MSVFVAREKERKRERERFNAEGTEVGARRAQRN
jgi:hypothetical protein